MGCRNGQVRDIKTGNVSGEPETQSLNIFSHVKDVHWIYKSDLYKLILINRQMFVRFSFDF